MAIPTRSRSAESARSDGALGVPNERTNVVSKRTKRHATRYVFFVLIVCMARASFLAARSVRRHFWCEVLITCSLAEVPFHDDVITARPHEHVSLDEQRLADCIPLTSG